MTIMWINLSLVYVLSFFSRYFSISVPTMPNFIRPNRLLVLSVIVILVTVSGLRNNIGDTFSYMFSYKSNNFTFSDIDYSGDFGFNILQLLLQKISKDPQILILVTAAITNLLIVIILSKYSRIVELSIYVYITSDMFTTSMNGIRQYLAAAITFTATKYLLNGDFRRYAIIIILASTIHKSALVLLPIYFIVRREAWTKTTLFLLSFSIVIVLGFNEFSDLLFKALEDTQYGHYSTFDGGGANKIRIFVTAAPVIIAFFGKQKLRELWPKSDYIVNMSIVSTVFITIASQNWIFARFNIYFGLYNLILISWIILLFKESNRKLIYYIILICYLIYFYYEHVISYGFIYKSDYINI
ncbi:EpsG family protein [Neobacillus vireti]|uniref:EpsG family protein n=1 Tax=Neobacillus vireti TaxID=220686 RepID=UPI002FFD6C92